MSGPHDMSESTGEGLAGPPVGDEVSTGPGVASVGPRLVHRDGVAYVEGCDIPIWRLEMARRAGAAPAALLKVFPALTPEGLDRAFAYARQHAGKIDAAIDELGLDDVPPQAEEDDEAEFRADLDEIFERDAELLRRLAQ